MSTERCDAFVRFKITDNQESRMTSCMDDRISLHGVESLRYRTFDDDQTDSAQPQHHHHHQVLLQGKTPKTRAAASSSAGVPNPSTKQNTDKKSKDLDKYLDSIHRRYTRLYDDTTAGEKTNTPSIISLSSGLSGFAHIRNWLMTSDSSNRLEEERKQKDAMYVLHHASIASQLFLNERNTYPVHTNKSPRNDSALTEALIAGGFKMSRAKEIMTTPQKEGLKIHTIFRSWQCIFQPFVVVLRGILSSLVESLRKYVVSKIRVSDHPFVSMIMVTYLTLFLTR